ncbi:hypothetical protein ACH5RR_022689 [Cinchona calisaya]|uniref:ZF-HD dimerization-type domain-containing protein n=1 Tax=Cinchona calisaya TaxID=153742 RepID=A0ABD2Z8H9_9GENT
MELPSQEGEMPLPLSSTYVGGQGHTSHVHGHSLIHLHDHHPVLSSSSHHNHIIPSSAAPPPHNQNGPTISSSTLDHHQEQHHDIKKMVRYKECLKNHAASMGGNATDGCGEFMPSGEEGTLEALTCSACNCHRNFHRKEIEGEPSSCDFFHSPHLNRLGRKLIVGPPHHKSLLGPPETLGYPTAGGTHQLIPARAAAPPQHHHPMIMSYNMGSHSESDEEEEEARPPPHHHHHHHHQLVRKRFRTKFTQEQKEKMLNFAEKVGWKLQKQEEAVVQQFCQELGVKRRVLKVWMHNNKHNLAKKTNNNNIIINASSNNNIISPQNQV